MILVVDDDKDIRESLDDLLTFNNYSCDQAHSAEVALSKLKKQHYDVVILDLVMDGMGGMGFLEQYQEIDPLTQVVVLTAYPTYETAVTALSGGTEAQAVAYLDKRETYLEKPTKPSELLGTINNLLVEKRVGDFSINLRDKTVMYQNKPFELRPRSFQLFSVFMLHPNKWFTYPELAKIIHGQDMDAATAKGKLKTHVYVLREALKEVCGEEIIKSRQGLGFALLQKRVALLPKA